MQFPVSPFAAVGLMSTSLGLLVSIIIMIVVVSFFRVYEKLKREDIEREKRCRQRLDGDQHATIEEALTLARDILRRDLREGRWPELVQKHTELLAELEPLQDLIFQAHKIELIFLSPPVASNALRQQ
jgi:hypothetical protein